MLSTHDSPKLCFWVAHFAMRVVTPNHFILHLKMKINEIVVIETESIPKCDHLERGPYYSAGA